MSNDTLVTAGRVALAKLFLASKFLIAVSRGNPAWDSLWNTPNPPTPPLNATNVLDLIAYCRPTLVEYVAPDDAGEIVDDGGAKFSVSATPTRYVRIKLSIPPGELSPNKVRELGLFMNPIIDASVPPSQYVIPGNKVMSPGDLTYLHWREAQPLEAGDHFSRNFIVRL